jgi:hypothetical protein
MFLPSVFNQGFTFVDHPNHVSTVDDRTTSEPIEKTDDDKLKDIETNGDGDSDNDDMQEKGAHID